MNTDSAKENTDRLKVGVAQIAPVWLNREATLEQAVSFVSNAAAEGCRLFVSGEALVPGYPFWIERTNGARGPLRTW